MKLGRMKTLTQNQRGFGAFNLQYLAPEAFRAIPSRWKKARFTFFIDGNDNLCAEHEDNEWIFTEGEWVQGK